MFPNQNVSLSKYTTEFTMWLFHDAVSCNSTDTDDSTAILSKAIVVYHAKLYLQVDLLLNQLIQETLYIAHSFYFDNDSKWYWWEKAKSKLSIF